MITSTRTPSALNLYLSSRLAYLRLLERNAEMWAGKWLLWDEEAKVNVRG